MAELHPWSNELGEAPEGVRELLEAARALRPMPAATQVKALAQASELAAAKSAGALALLGGKALVTAVLGGAACASVALVLAHRHPQGDLPERPAAPIASAPARPAPLAPSVAVPPPTVGVDELPRLPSAHPSLPRPGALADETDLIERARASLRTDPARALELSREHARRFPQGQLRSAGQVVAIEALLRLGRRDEARASAEAFFAQAPDGLYAERIRRLLDAP